MGDGGYSGQVAGVAVMVMLTMVACVAVVALMAFMTIVVNYDSLFSVSGGELALHASNERVTLQS